MTFLNGKLQTLAFTLLATCSLVAVAAVQAVTCSFQLEYEYFPELRPELVKTCSDPEQLSEACTGFSFRSVDKKHAYTDVTAGVQKERGFVEFKPVSLSSYEEKVRGMIERRWLLYMVDNSGAAAAQERFAVVDAAFKPVTKVMTYVEKEKYIKTRRAKVNDEPMKCRVGPSR